MKPILYALTAALLTQTSWAAPNSSTSSTTKKSVAPQLLEKITLGVAGLYVGPSLGHIGAKTSNPDGSLAERNQYFDMSVGAGYKLTESIIVGANFNFIYVPVAGQDFILKDPHVRLTHQKLVNFGNFNLTSDIRLYPGVSPNSISGSMLLGARTTHLATYSVPGTALTLSAWGFLRWNWYGLDAETGNDVVAVLIPGASYQLTKTLAATLNYELDRSHGLAEDITEWWSNDGNYLMVGVNWDPAPNMSFNPFISYSPGNEINLNTASLGMIFSARFL